MKPLCSAPKRFPAPRMSRSCMAMCMPLPNSEKLSMACNRRRASTVSVAQGWCEQVTECLFGCCGPHGPGVGAVRSDPKFWALLMIIVLVFGISIPDSMMVVASQHVILVVGEADRWPVPVLRDGICPCPIDGACTRGEPAYRAVRVRRVGVYGC